MLALHELQIMRRSKRVLSCVSRSARTQLEVVCLVCVSVYSSDSTINTAHATSAVIVLPATIFQRQSLVFYNLDNLFRQVISGLNFAVKEPEKGFLNFDFFWPTIFIIEQMDIPYRLT